MLREGAGALAQLAGGEVHPRGTEDALEVEAWVGVEDSVFHCLQCGRQQRRRLPGREDQPIFAVAWEEAAHLRRFDASDGQFAAGAIVDANHSAAVEFDGKRKFPPLPVSKAEGAQDGSQRVAVCRPGPGRARELHFAIAKPSEFPHHVALRQPSAGIKLHRRGIDARRQRPPPTFKRAGDLPVEEEEIACDGGEDHATRNEPPAQAEEERPPQSRRLLLAPRGAPLLPGGFASRWLAFAPCHLLPLLTSLGARARCPRPQRDAPSTTDLPLASLACG